VKKIVVANVVVANVEPNVICTSHASFRVRAQVKIKIKGVSIFVAFHWLVPSLGMNEKINIRNGF
jgi:hypothetical protein